MEATSSTADRAIRPEEATRITGMSRTSLWRLVRANQLPAPRELTTGTVFWLESEILDWLRSRPQKQRARG